MFHLIILAIIIAFAETNARPVLQDHVDFIEVNHHYDKHGWPVMDQVIFYQWCPLQIQSRYRVRDWRSPKSFTQVPAEDFRSAKYTNTWKDGRYYGRITVDQFRVPRRIRS